MCTCRCASVHGLRKMAHQRRSKGRWRDSSAGINHLWCHSIACPAASVAVVPKDSGSNVAVVPKDSSGPELCACRFLIANVAVLPNNRAHPSPTPLPAGQNRRRIGRESALRRIVRTSSFCQSGAVQGAFRPESGQYRRSKSKQKQWLMAGAIHSATPRHGRTQTLTLPPARWGAAVARPTASHSLPPSPIRKTGRTATFDGANRVVHGNLSAERRRLSRSCGTGGRACGLWLQPT
jgi:hypothetical protein